MNVQLIKIQPAQSHSMRPLLAARALGLVATLIIGLTGLQPSQGADFAAGFERFRSLGLPDVKDAKYVKVQWKSGSWQYQERNISGRGPNLEGNAWLLDQTNPQRVVVLAGNMQRVELLDPKAHAEEQKKRMEKYQKAAEAANPEEMEFSMEDFEEKASGTWKEADLKKDMDQLIAFLSKASSEREIDLFDDGTTRFFLMAAHAHRKGLTTEANQVVDLLFQKVGDSRKVLSKAMGELADHQYEQAYEAFTGSGNWQQYLAAMDAVIGKFPGVWRQRPVVERVAAAVRKHLELKEPPAIVGEGLTEEDQKIASELAKGLGNANSMMISSHNSLWVAGQALPGASKMTKSAMGKISERGVKSIPLLIAMLNDSYLIKPQGTSSHSTHYSSSEDDQPMSPEEIDMQYEHFSRPHSRGEIARGLLESLVMEQEERYDNDRRPDNEEIAKRAREWYAKHKDKSGSDLLRFFLSEGKQQERQMALHYLMASDAEADRKEVEKYLLSPDKVAENLNFVVNYARQKGSSAKALVQQYLTAAKALPSLVSAEQLKYMDDSSRKRREDQAKSQLKILEEMASDKTAENLLKEILAENKKWTQRDWQKISQILFSKLGQEEPEKAVRMVLQAAVDAKDDLLAQSLMQSAQQVRYLGMQRRMVAGGTTPQKPPALDIQKAADLWKKLMDQKRGESAGDDEEDEMVFYTGMGRGTTFQQTVALIVEGLYAENPQASMHGYQLIQQVGPRAYSIYVDRARARLDGKAEAELPEFPDKSKVTEARKSELLKQLQGTPPDKLTSFADGLALTDIMVLNDIVSADAALNQKLVPESHVIRKVRVTIKNEELRKLAESFKGKRVDRKTVESLVEEARKALTNATSAAFTLSRSSPLSGVELSITPVPEMMLANRYGSGPGVAMLAGSLMSMSESEPIYGNAQWPVPLPSKPSTEKKKAGGDDDLLQSAVQKWDPLESTCRHASLSIL